LGSGTTSVGVVDPAGQWYLRNSNNAGAPDFYGELVQFGQESLVRDRRRGAIEAGTENADPNEVGAQLLALQTQMQASLQTTAMLAKLSLVNFL
jgi:hypothetical protein